jgi:NDP-sugar pyrophosphorylase family protein
MKTMILCAGQGTRLNEETEYRPKLIFWQIMKTYAIDGYNRFIHYLDYMADLLAPLPVGIPLSIEFNNFPSLIGQAFYRFHVSGLFLDISLLQT